LEHIKRTFGFVVRFIVTITVIVGALTLASWGWDVRNDAKHTVTVNSSTPVFMGSGDEACTDKQMLTTVRPSIQLKVLRIRYWKNCATLNVILPDSRQGYIVIGEGGFSVNPPLP